MSDAERVYVIDDDDAVRHSMCMLLDSYGIAARLYTSGASLLADLPLEHGCLLIDVNMPGMNGLELFSRLRGLGIAIPVIFMSAAPTRSIRLAVSRAGATLLQKPFRTAELIASIEKALGRYK
jgi:two-component system, LuxR family, response regulator FixJ